MNVAKEHALALKQKIEDLLGKALQKSKKAHATMCNRFGAKTVKIIYVALVAAMLGILSSHRSFTSQPTKTPFVLVERVKKRDVPIYYQTVGTVTALESVSLKAQVSAKIEKILFKEGEFIKKGDPLIQLESTYYQAQVDQYKGQLLKDQAILENAKVDLVRYQNLSKQDSVSKQTLDTQKSLVKQYEGLVKYDQGVLDATLVTLGYCKITSPIDGLIGLKQVNAGNYVTPTDSTALVTITQLSPLSVVFSIPETNLAEIQKHHSKQALTVDIYDKNDAVLLESGTLQAFDSQIDQTTGTLKARGLVTNKDQKLFPNQFVNIHLKINTLESALVVPTHSLQKGKENNYLYLFDEQTKKVRQLNVKIIHETKDNTTAIETPDLKEDDLIVTQGNDKLLDGQEVKTKQEEKNIPEALKEKAKQ